MDNFDFINTSFAIVAISVLAWLVYQFAPLLQRMLDGQFGSYQEHDDYSINQPLYQIFYQFQHKTSTEWIKWILKQNEETKAKAYERLQTYLENPARKLGLNAKDVIIAVAAFNRKDGFETLKKFLENVRPFLGSLKTIELFYSELLAALIKLDLTKGAIVLRGELDYFSQKRDTDEINYDDFRVKIIRTFALMEVVPKETKDTMVEFLCNGNYKSTVRRELVQTIANYEITNVIEYVYPRVLKFFLQDEGPEINAHTVNVLEFLFYNFKEIGKNNVEIWNLLLQACHKEKTQELYTGMMTRLIADRTEKFNYQRLLEILKIEEPLKDTFWAALKERNGVTDDEIALFRPKLKQTDINFDCDTIVVEKSRKTKSVTHTLNEQYRRFVAIIQQDSSSSNKAERRASHSIKLITGTSIKEKIYLLRALAANENRSFIYIDIIKMIYDQPELTKLLSTVNNNKPAIVYIDNVLQMLNSKLEDGGRSGLNLFFKTLRELAILPSVTFFGGLAISGHDLQKMPELKQTINSGIKGSFDLSINLDMPTTEEKLAIITNIVGKISIDKVDRNFNPNSLLVAEKQESFLEFWSELCEYFEQALMVKGRLMDPDKLFANQADDDLIEDDEPEEAVTKLKEEVKSDDAVVQPEAAELSAV